MAADSTEVQSRGRGYREGFAYVTVAGLAAGADWAVFTALSLLLPTLEVVFAQSAARLTGGIVAFIMHRAWSFKDQKGIGIGTEARRFLMLYVFSFLVSVGTVYVLVDLLELNRYWSKAAADTLCFVLNFVVMKFYVFSDTRLSQAKVLVERVTKTA